MQIRVSSLTFEYPNRAFRLHVPSLRVESGASAALIGPSGSGKSTFLRLLGGIHPIPAGALHLDTVDLSSLNEAARRAFRIGRIGFVFQDFQLVEYLDVEGNIRLPFRIHPALTWSPEAAGRLQSLAHATGIADKLRRPVAQLSQGEKQRVAICRALLTEPSLVLADEPTGNLDPLNKRRILEILFDETRKRGATLVMVTHDQDLVGDFQQVIDFQQFHASPA
jgi:putative ABC transport system ATP-binding protein